MAKLMRDGEYEIRIKGRLDDALAQSIGEFSQSVQPSETVLRGHIVDQSELQGVLARLQDLGLELLELRRVDDGAPR
jgi:hypothetical protein